MLKAKSGSKIKSPNDLKGHEAIKKQLAMLKDMQVKIGYPSENPETASEEDGVSAASKATINNFGLGVPKRPFMSISYYSNLGKYKKFIAKNLGNIEKMNFKTMLEQLGNMGRGDVIDTIDRGVNPPNSAAVIAKKGENRPLIDSSHMINSTTYAVVSK